MHARHGLWWGWFALALWAAACGDDGGGGGGGDGDLAGDGDAAGDGDGSGGQAGDGDGSGGQAGDGDASGTGGMMVPVGTFEGFTGPSRKLGTESRVACALDGGGEIVCQGQSSSGWQENAPEGSFEKIDMGRDSACVLDAQGLLSCWEDFFSSIDQPLEGPFTDLAVGDDERGCGIRPSGYLECWDSGFGFRGDLPSDETFVSIDIDDDWGCGITTEGNLRCWGGGEDADGDFTKVVTHGSGVCTLDSAGAIACHDGSQTRHVPTDGPYVDLSVGYDHICGLKADGSVQCNGDNTLGRLPPPDGPWAELRSYNSFACARAADGESECWGRDFGDGGADLMCEPGRSLLDGTLDGAAYSGDINLSGQYSSGSLQAGYRFTHSTAAAGTMGPGMVVFDGPDVFVSNVAERALGDAGTVTVDRALLQLQATATDPGPLYCTGAGSGSTIELNIDEVSVDLKNIHAQACPGTPVDGEVVLCSNSDCGGNPTGGTLDGKAFSHSTSQSRWQSGPGYTVLYGRDHDLIRVSNGADGAVRWAVIATGPETEFGGAVYCAGADSIYEDVDGSVHYTLRNLSKLDACPTDASDDSLTGCVR